MNKQYQNKLEERFSRGSFANPEDEAYFYTVMEKRYTNGFDSYWHWFGYEIGGPVCYSFVKWIDETLRRHSEVTGLAFVARDGWILREVYEILKGGSGLPDEYVYAPRSICLQCKNNEELMQKYRKYIAKFHFGKGIVGIVDTVTMNFSAMGLISSSICKQTLGLFWVVLQDTKRGEKKYVYESYQEEQYHTIKNWNLIEYIITSPEPPIASLGNNDRPVYQSVKGFETEREKRFVELENGVLDFVRDVVAGGKMPTISNSKITSWVNDFLKHPDSQDRDAFSDVIVSECADHSDCKPMDPFCNQLLSPKKWKDALWLYSQRHPHMYRVLRWGKKRLKYYLKE